MVGRHENETDTFNSNYSLDDKFVWADFRRRHLQRTKNAFYYLLLDIYGLNN